MAYLRIRHWRPYSRSFAHLFHTSVKMSRLTRSTDELQVLAAAAALLNGKPTKDNDFGRKVEFAMQLVSTSLYIRYFLLTKEGSHNVSDYICGNQRT